MNFKKLLSEPFPDYLIKVLHDKSANYLLKKEEKADLQKERIWQSNFKKEGELFFEHELDKGIKILLYRDSILSRYIYEGFEKDEIEFLKRILKQGDTFIDIGSNIGLFSLHASKLVGKTGKVFSIEPSPVTYKRLVNNISLNSFDNMTPINKGLSNEEGELSLYISNNGYDAWNSFAAVDSNKVQSTVNVPVTTMDKLLKDYNINRDTVSLVKIDVEGWEKFVLQGGRSFLTQFTPVVMMEFTEANTFSAGYLVQEIYDIMVEMGYNWYKYEKSKLTPDPKRLHYPYNNLIAVKNSSRTQELLSSFL
jgi:FkbM family methyltransferase